MRKLFSKRDINNMILKETKGYFILNKKDLRLNEDNSNAFVEPSNDNISSLSSDLNKTRTENPTDDTFIVNANSYNGDSSDNTVTLDVQGNNVSDATRNYQKTVNSPAIKNLMGKTNVNAKIHLKNESLQRLREGSVPFTKKEINEMLKK